MKANGAPEKIYLSQERDKDGCYIDLMWHKHPYEDMENIQYTRTNAFIKKACEFIKDHHHEFSFWNTEEYELGFSTQKFIEDFKNYMKGE